MSASTTNRAIIAMSGGVDSSVAAMLAIERGLDCIGAMMKLFSNEDAGECAAKSCCSIEDANDARSVADKLDIPFYVFNFMDTFREEVISRFVKAYENGETPNPCIDCNRYLKFDRLFRRAKETDREYIVTGHYARIAPDKASGRYILQKGVDSSKDQSYVLYAMTQEQLKHTIFPLGELYKSQVREIALKRDFVNAKKHDSQDICFVRSGTYADFIQRYSGRECRKGRFVDTDGNDLGEHKGIIHYTVGQRKGLGLSTPERLYVCSVSAEDNSVTLGKQDELYAKTLLARDINLIPVDRLDAPAKVHAKIRYKQQEEPATAWQIDADTLRIEFEYPQKAMTKGQAVVLYDGDTVIGGGTISAVGTK